MSLGFRFQGLCRDILPLNNGEVKGEEHGNWNRNQVTSQVDKNTK